MNTEEEELKNLLDQLLTTLARSVVVLGLSRKGGNDLKEFDEFRVRVMFEILKIMAAAEEIGVKVAADLSDLPNGPVKDLYEELKRRGDLLTN